MCLHELLIPKICRVLGNSILLGNLFHADNNITDSCNKGQWPPSGTNPPSVILQDQKKAAAETRPVSPEGSTEWNMIVY